GGNVALLDGGTIGQSDAHVHFGGAEAEVRERGLAAGITVAGRDFVKAEEAVGVAELPGGVDAHLRADAHAVHAPSADADIEPVILRGAFIVERAAGIAREPADEKEVHAAVAVVVAGWAGRVIDGFAPRGGGCEMRDSIGHAGVAVDDRGDDSAVVPRRRRGAT